jgi:hypothetical protein
MKFARKGRKHLIKELTINDNTNPFKAHVFRIYADRHITYNQAINGKNVYRKFQRSTPQSNGYHELLKQHENCIKVLLKAA